jgi:lipoprotein-releasing system ATP-binding protein
MNNQSANRFVNLDEKSILARNQDTPARPLSEANEIVLQCCNLEKEYIDADTRLKILIGVSLTVKRGEQIAIMGRSGSGKTTLLQMLGGLDSPTAGEVLINGQNIHALNEADRCRLRNSSIGYIYQFHHLLPEFTALENVVMPLLIANADLKIAKKRAAELLEQVGLQDRLHHKPGAMSGGERQRVAIARALINNPVCILADEPTGNLDDENANQVFEVLCSINRRLQTSILLVTHDVDLAAKLDRTVILQGGQLHPQ